MEEIYSENKSLQEDVDRLIHVYINHPEYGVIKPQTIRSLINYVVYGIPTGHFLHNLLANNLSKTIHHADDENMIALRAIVKFVYNEIPHKCHGSYEAIVDYKKEYNYENPNKKWVDFRLI